MLRGCSAAARFRAMPPIERHAGWRCFHAAARNTMMPAAVYVYARYALPPRYLLLRRATPLR